MIWRLTTQAGRTIELEQLTLFPVVPHVPHGNELQHRVERLRIMQADARRAASLPVLAPAA